MRLSEIFLKEARKERGWPEDSAELVMRIVDWMDSKSKLDQSRIQPKQKSAYHVSTRGDAEFGDAFEPAVSTNGWGITEKPESDLNLTLPFRLELVGGNFAIDGMKKLNTLEGSPTEVLGNVSIVNCPKLTSLEHFPAKIGSDVTVRNCKNVKSLKGMPDTLNGDIKLSNIPIENFEGMPEHIKGDVDFGFNTITSLIGIGDHVKFVGGCIRIIKRNIVSGGLGLMLIKGLKEVIPDKVVGKSPWIIINKYLGQSDKIFECQEELINAGYEAFAEL